MSCYFRHMKEILDSAGITVTPENRKRLDTLIHSIVHVNYKNCPDAWRKIKQEIRDNTSKSRFAAALKKEFGKIG